MPARTPGISWLSAEPLETEIHSFTHSLIHSAFPEHWPYAGTGQAAVNKTGKVLPSEAHSVIGGTDVKRMSQCQENATLRGEKGDGGNTAGERCGGERCL